MNNIKRYCLLTVATCTVITTHAAAQSGNYYSRDKYEAVTDRPQPAFDPEPVRLGAFVVNATGVAGATATSNAYGSPVDEQSDIIARIGADVSARTNWSVHEIGVNVAAYHDEYLDLSDESSDTLSARLRGRLDVTRALALGASVFAESRSEPRTNPSNTGGLASPIDYTRQGAEFEANYANDRTRWTNSVRFTDANYKDGTQLGTGLTIDEDFRDQTTTEGRSRFTYAVSPNLAVFAQGTVMDQAYDNAQLIGGALRKRDSRGYTASGGIDFELSALIRGDIAVGYLNEKKDDSFFKDVSGLSVDGTMQWFPSRLTTATFNASRRVVDVGLFESPSALATDLRGRVDHELRRNIILSGWAGFTSYDYQEIDSKDELQEIGASVTYKMNKKVHGEAFVRHYNRDTSGSAVTFDNSFGVDLIGVELRLRP